MKKLNQIKKEEKEGKKKANKQKEEKLNKKLKQIIPTKRNRRGNFIDDDDKKEDGNKGDIIINNDITNNNNTENIENNKKEENGKKQTLKFRLSLNPSEIFEIDTDKHQKFIIVFKNLIIKYPKLQEIKIKYVKYSSVLLYSDIIKSNETIEELNIKENSIIDIISDKKNIIKKKIINKDLYENKNFNLNGSLSKFSMNLKENKKNLESSSFNEINFNKNYNLFENKKKSKNKKERKKEYYNRRDFGLDDKLYLQ